jgi:hydrophobic/amphiphilic exporter-1 (mainly G- bacteria), HAE1 family
LGSENYGTMQYTNDWPGVNLGVSLLPGANALEVSKKIKNVIAKASKKFPKDFKCVIGYNNTMFIHASIESIIKTLILSIILVAIIVFIFLQNIRSSIIPLASIPVSIIGTFAVLAALNYTINTIVLFGLILAIGIVVDDAIIIIENINRIIKEEGLNSKEATLKSMEQMTSPIIATTFVLLGVFLPVAFIPGITGELYRQFAVTIVVCVLFSAFNALTLSPALSAILLRKHETKTFILFKWFNSLLDFTANKYNKSVKFLLRKVIYVGIALIIIFIAGFIFLKIIPTGFIPNEDQGVIFVNVETPAGSSLPLTNAVMTRACNIIKKNQGVKDIVRITGFSMLEGTTSSNTGLICVILDDWSKRKEKKLHASAICTKLSSELGDILDANIIAFTPPLYLDLVQVADSNLNY